MVAAWCIRKGLVDVDNLQAVAYKYLWSGG
jgi:hypothetical protein